MTSRGGANRRRWGYVWVFLAPLIVALPLMLLPMLLLSLGLGVDLPYWALRDSKSTVIFVLTMPVVITYVIVRIYYWRQDARRANLLHNPVQNSENLK
jgi:hypothetical protein